MAALILHDLLGSRKWEARDQRGACPLTMATCLGGVDIAVHFRPPLYSVTGGSKVGEPLRNCEEVKSLS